MAQGFLFPGGILSLPREAAQRMIKAQNGDAVLYYLALLAGEEASLSWPRERIEAAHAALVSLSLLDATKPPEVKVEQKLEPDAPPEYGQEDVTLALREGAGFSTLVGELERRLGKLLAPSDLQTLLLLYDYLALPPEVILLLSSYSIEQMQKKYGEGRKPTMSQIKKEAFRWHRAGIDTLETAETHLLTLAKRSEAAARILPLLDIVGRSPVEAERRYLEAWGEMGFDDAALRLAYEKTVLKKQSLSWPYMNSILRSWHQKGLHTKAEIVEKEQGTWKKPAAATSGVSAPETQERARRDLDRLDRLLGELKGES